MKIMKNLNEKELELINGGETGDAAEAIGVIAGIQWAFIAPQLWWAKKAYDYFS
jgi:bacteriocin-like protein